MMTTINQDWALYLRPHEQLLRQGTLLPGIRNRGRLIFLTAIGLPFLLFGVAGTSIGVQEAFFKGNLGLGLFTFALGLVFAGLGYGLVFFQWAEASRAHRQIRYALYNRCASIAREPRRRQLECYPIPKNTALELEHCMGYDNVWFHTRREADSANGITTSRFGFEGIENGAEVYRLMRAIQTGTT